MFIRDSSSHVAMACGQSPQTPFFTEVPPRLERTSTGLSIISKVSSLPQAGAVVTGEDGGIFYFHPYLGKISNLTNIFQMGLDFCR